MAQRQFRARLAHEKTDEGKVICPECGEEIKRIKVIRNKNKKAYRPTKSFLPICKCNKKDILNGKI